MSFVYTPPDLWPFIRFPDGAQISRVVTHQGWRDTVLSMWRTPSRTRERTGQPHWTELVSPPNEHAHAPELHNPQFVYIDPTGRTLASVLVDPYDRDVIDAAGPGMGVVDDPVARARMLALIYHLLLPDSNNPMSNQVRAKLRSPQSLTSSTFREKQTRKETLLDWAVDARSRGEVVRLQHAAEMFAKSKGLRPWGWQSLRAVHVDDSNMVVRFQSPRARWAPVGGAVIGIALHLEPSRAQWERNYGVVATHWPDTPPRWVAYVFEKQAGWEGHWQPVEMLGWSDSGPFEALVDAGVYISRDDLDDWLDEHTDNDWDARPILEASFLLDLPSPLLLPQDEFIAWIRGAGSW